MSEPSSHYDRITRAWNIVLGDDFHHGVFDSGTEDLAAATHKLTSLMIAAGGIQPGMRVLDMGCGTGAQACQLAADHGASVVGLSTSEVGVTMARSRAAEAGLADRVAFEQVDALDSGLPDASFDVLWLIESAQYLVPHERMWRECSRLLRPGGRLVLSDVVLRRSLELRDLRALHSELSILRETFGDAQMTTVDDLVSLAAASRLKIIDVEDLTDRVRPTFGRWRDRARRSRGRVVALIGQDAWESFVGGCDVLEAFWDDGIAGYALISARKPESAGVA